MSEGGFLPRFTQSVGKAQKSLVEDALQQNSRDTVFCSHFTVVNYATDTPLSATGQVATVNYGFSKFEYGAAKDGRTHLHGDWIRNNRFSLTLSGHSHRAGLYKCQFVPSREIIKSPYPQLASPDSKEYIPEHLKTEGYHPGCDGAKAATWAGQTKVLVSASTGPVSKQNRDGEMIGYGMEHPAGSRITTDGAIAMVNSSHANARPRFCVACDYIDLLGEGFWEYFKAKGSNGSFEMKPYWEKIQPNMSEAAKRTLIESVTLWLVESGNSVDYVSTPKLNATNTLDIAMPQSLTNKLYSRRKYIEAIFISIKFKAVSLKTIDGFKKYDYGSPWNIQVGIYDGKGKAVDVSKSGLNPSQWQIMRHKEKGEIPDFEWRMVNWPLEFANNAVKQKKKKP